jgi:hypothetical protein
LADVPANFKATNNNSLFLIHSMGAILVVLPFKEIRFIIWLVHSAKLCSDVKMTLEKINMRY